MNEILTQLGGLTIYVYGVGLLVSLLVALFLLWREIKRTSLNEEKIFDACFAAGVVGIVAGRALFLLLNSADFQPTVLTSLLIITYPGINEFGFLAGFFISWLVYAKRHRVDFFLIVRLLSFPLLSAKLLLTVFSLVRSFQVYRLYELGFLTTALWLIQVILGFIRREKLPLRSLFYILLAIISVDALLVDFFGGEKVYLFEPHIVSVHQFLYGTLLLWSTGWGIWYFLRRKRKTPWGMKSVY